MDLEENQGIVPEGFLNVSVSHRMYFCRYHTLMIIPHAIEHHNQGPVVRKAFSLNGG